VTRSVITRLRRSGAVHDSWRIVQNDNTMSAPGGQPRVAPQGSYVLAAKLPVMLQNPPVGGGFGRVLGVNAALCVVIHVPLVAGHLRAAPVLGIVMILASLACIPCIRKLWTKPTTHDCSVAGALAAVMIILHSCMAMGMGAGGADALSSHNSLARPHNGITLRHNDDGLAQVGHELLHPVGQGGEVLYFAATALASLQIVCGWLAVQQTVRRLRQSRTERDNCLGSQALCVKYGSDSIHCGCPSTTFGMTPGHPRP
jgi:hypothetical protein